MRKLKQGISPFKKIKLWFKVEQKDKTQMRIENLKVVHKSQSCQYTYHHLQKLFLNNKEKTIYNGLKVLHPLRNNTSQVGPKYTKNKADRS